MTFKGHLSKDIVTGLLESPCRNEGEILDSPEFCKPEATNDPFLLTIGLQNSAENFSATAEKARRQKIAGNFANKSFAQRFYASLVHFLRGLSVTDTLLVLLP